MARKPAQHQQSSRVVAATQTQTLTHYEGLVPHPDILRGFDSLVPGTAEKLIKMAEEETMHRRKLEVITMDANVALQRQQIQIEVQRSKDVFRSDIIGQIAGFAVCISCIAASVYLGINNHDILAGSIAVIPTAALIKAFTLTKNPNKN